MQQRDDLSRDFKNEYECSSAREVPEEPHGNVAGREKHGVVDANDESPTMVE